MKSISTINPAIIENMKRLIVKTGTQLLNKLVDVLLDHDINISIELFKI